MQQGRFVFPDDDPLSDLRRYLVTITNRGRDLAALTRLEPAVAAGVAPSIRLIHLGGPADRVTSRRVRDWAAEIRGSVRGRAYHVELTEFDPLQPVAPPGSSLRRRRRGSRTDGSPLLVGLMGELTRQGQHPVPVVRLGPMTERLRSVVVTVAHGAPNGLALAVPLGHRWTTAPEVVADVRTAVDRLRVDPGHTDLVLEAPVDQGHRLGPSELATVVRRVREAGPWRNVVLLSSGVPAIVPRPDPERPLLVVPRPDWPLFGQLHLLLGDERPTFGDYGTRHPLRLTWPGTKRANVRYTCEAETLVALGAPTRNGVGDGPGYAALCRAVAGHVLFRGSNHCWGCRMIEAGAGDSRPGGAASAGDAIVPALQSAWDTVGLVHHITELTAQLRSL
ncbi:MAG: hypothetical protein R2761_15730 [Acidimicrobiales bacterium]